MTDKNRAPSIEQFAELPEHLCFRQGIERAGRFIQNNEVRLSQEGSSQSDLLPLACAQLLSFGEPVPQHCIITLGQMADDGVRSRAAACSLDTGPVGWIATVIQCDVLSDRERLASPR